MSSKMVQWIIWSIVMAIFSALSLSGRTAGLATAIAVTAVVWYGIVPAVRSGRQ